MSNSRRVNVLVYSGAGATVDSVKHATWSLRRLLGPNYAVHTITSDQLLKEPWTSTCALLVVPGGADLSYCRVLNGTGNIRIKQFVQLGGAYLGFCAGGYYGSARCEFEVGNKGMEVVGDRELAFFPGTCRGLAFPGFVYQSEAGARAVIIKPNPGALGNDGSLAAQLPVYYNGGGVFVGAENCADQGVEVLATYAEPLAVEAGRTTAAVVYCKVGEGGAMVTGPHAEFSGYNLEPENASNPDYGRIVHILRAEDSARTHFMKACLTKLGLQVSDGAEEVPSLSPLHLSTSSPYVMSELLRGLHEQGAITKSDDEESLVGESETFKLDIISSTWSLRSIKKAVTDVVESTLSPNEKKIDLDNGDDADSRQNKSSAEAVYEKATLRLFVHEHALPEMKQTPHFNHHAYFHNLKSLRSRYPSENPNLLFGEHLMYGEVVTSTSTLLEKNPSILSHLPDGFTVTATTQVAGRGRGSNVWVSPPGSLMFSTVMRHPLSLTGAPVVFVQYLAAMATVQGIHQYDISNPGYSKLDIRLKWPNDVYALDPSSASGSSSIERKLTDYVKIAGILVNSSYGGGGANAAYTLVVGIGVNVENAAPTTSLSRLASAAGLPAFRLETLLASILVQFESLYTRFCRTGFDKWFEERYYTQWLHTDQIVTLETENWSRARIKGISADFGLLIAEEVGESGRSTGRKFQLQSDSNSFDFFKGLLKRKL